MLIVMVYNTCLLIYSKCITRLINLKHVIEWSAADFVIILLNYFVLAITKYMRPNVNRIISILICVTNHHLTIKQTYLANVSNEEFVIAVRACVAYHKATTTWSNGA